MDLDWLFGPDWIFSPGAFLSLISSSDVQFCMSRPGVDQIFYSGAIVIK
jgi:hypothetical protein